MKCRWVHIIDSNSAHATPDEGSFSKLPNGDDLEIGSMPCPEKGGVITPYEEIWRKIPPSSGSNLSWILQTTGDGNTFIGRIGGGFIALQQGENGFAARSESWDDASGKWVEKYAIGPLEGSPSMVAIGERALDGEERWTIGETVEVQGRKYVVRAFELLA